MVGTIFLNVEKEAEDGGLRLEPVPALVVDTVGLGVVEDVEGHEVNITSITCGNE